MPEKERHPGRCFGRALAALALQIALVTSGGYSGTESRTIDSPEWDSKEITVGKDSGVIMRNLVPNILIGKLWAPNYMGHLRYMY